MNNKLRAGISACLLGQNLRYDGGNKLDHYLKDTLGAQVEWIGICPEVGAGLPVPREPMRLVGDPESPRLVTVSTGIDLTGQIEAWTEEWLRKVQTADIQGFVFKSGSPSCGLKGVDVFSLSGQLSSRGAGIFCAAFMKRFPLLAVEDEQTLQDAKLRKNFIDLLDCFRSNSAGL